MVTLEYFDGTHWIECVGEFPNERMAWLSLGGDDVNYRSTADGFVLTDKSEQG